ncbi:MAG: 6-phosphogluconolactonase [Bacteroidia bacterium]|nr:6-phosphogluconolactonase [Bacteroidia bacterium]NNJ55529.1 6-phosphogluconolactonase [Bacteroidia bacterium]
MTITSFKTELELCINLRSELLEQLNDNKRIKNIAISGGSTPTALFNYLGNHPLSSELNNSANVFWVDERYVPTSDQRNNSSVALDLWFQHEDRLNIFPVKTEVNPIEKCAVEYASILKEKSNFKLDLVLLGMGLDGHIASIFPGQSHSTEVFSCKHPTDGTQRISMSLELLSKAEHIWLLINGEEKRKVLEKNMDLPIHKLIQKKDIKVYHLG